MNNKQMNKGKKKKNNNKNIKNNSKNIKNDKKIKESNNIKIEEKNKKKKKHTVLRVLLAIFIILLLTVGGFLGYSTYKNGWGLRGVLQTALGQDNEKLQDLDPFTVLILGVSEDITSKLTDTIIVASYNPKTQKATLLSVPRDTYIGKNKNKANTYDKINALYQKSPEKTLEAINELTGLNIKYYVVINNNALVELVDKIGGVEFDVPIKMKYTDTSQKLYINLEKGFQRLNGDQAEQLVRFRKNDNGTSYPSEYGDNDTGRMKTQREFLKAVAKQTLQVKNVTKIKSLMDIFKRNVTTNITDWNTVSAYIPYAIEFDTENIRTETIPGENDKYNNLWFFVANQKKTKELVDEIFLEQNGLPESEEDTNSIEENTTSNNTVTRDDIANLKIEVLNGTGDKVLLTEATKKLKEKGYNIYKTGSTSVTSKTTIVNQSDVDGELVSELKKNLGMGTISKSKGKSSQVDITIILGKDYK